VDKKINGSTFFTKYSACQTFSSKDGFLNGLKIIFGMCPGKSIGGIGVCFTKNMGNPKLISSDLDVFGIPA
jgi:hypothetical protein